MMKNELLTCLLFVSLLICKQANAQIASSTEIQSLAKDTVAMNFVQEATLGNLKEIETGRLAQLRSENKDVIDFGKRMVADHTDASDLLSAILKNKRMNIPEPSLPIDEDSKKLRNAQGEEFDKLYISMMLMDHQKTVNLFEKASQNVKDPDLKAFAAKLLPTLKEHFTLATQIESTLKNTTSTDTTATQDH